MASAPIEYTANGKHRGLRIQKVAQVDIEALEGQAGAPITISNHPLCIAPGEPAVAARSEKLSYNDHGMSWEVSRKNGFYSPFQYAS